MMMISLSTTTTLLVSFTLVLMIIITVSSSKNYLMISAQELNASARISDLLDIREQTLNDLVIAAEAATLTKCNSIQNFNKASYECQIPACGSDLPKSRGFECSTGFGVDPETCDEYYDTKYCKGLVRSYTTPSVLFPPGASNDDLEGQAFLTYSPALDRHVNAGLAAGKITAWTGLGSVQSAFHRVWPGAPRTKTEDGSECSPYQVTLRPWFSGAVFGARDLIIVADLSGSLFSRDCKGCKSRYELLVEAVSTLLGTLTHLDAFAIVTFSNTGKIITANGKPTLLQATGANKSAAMSALLKQRTSGTTSFASGFSEAFKILRQTTVSTKCLQNIVLITDGIPDDGSTINAYIKNQQATLAEPVYIFTITMSSGGLRGADTARSIACNNRGVHQHIPNGVEATKALSQYMKFLATGANDTATAWSSVYVDAFGLGAMSTVARVIFDKSNGQSTLSSVLSIDVPIGEFLELGTVEELESELRKRSAKCANVQFSDCLLQKLRNESGFECPDLPSFEECVAAGNVTKDYKCPTIQDPSTNPIVQSGGVNAMMCEAVDFRNNLPMKNSKPYDQVACCNCHLRGKVIAGIVVSSVAFVALVGVVVWFLVLRKRGGSGEGEEGDDRQNNGQQNNNNIAPKQVVEMTTENNNNNSTKYIQEPQPVLRKINSSSSSSGSLKNNNINNNKNNDSSNGSFGSARSANTNSGALSLGSNTTTTAMANGGNNNNNNNSNNVNNSAEERSVGSNQSTVVAGENSMDNNSNNNKYASLE